MEAKLIVVGGKANKAEVQLTLPAVIGRGRDADLTVAHATVSRRHCLLYERDGALVVRDNGSLNGTVIDGERIQEAVLRPGATLTVGPLTFRAEYDHQGDFPNLGEQPKLVHRAAAVAAQPANGTLYQESPAASAADSEVALGLPEPEHAAEDETPSFGFLSEPAIAGAPPAAHAPQPAAAESESEPSLSGASAKTSQASADSGKFAGSGLAASDAPDSAKQDSADFGFLGAMSEPEAPSGADSQLPEITLHDAEETPAANGDSGEYALLSDTAASPLDFPAAEKPVARGDQAYSLAATASASSADAADIRPAKASPSKQTGQKDAEEAPVKASADLLASDSDIDAAALGFLTDAPAAGKAEKSSKRSAKPAESSPDIKVGAEQPKAAEDEELNSFFNSLGLD